MKTQTDPAPILYMIEEILSYYPISPEAAIQQYGSGLINRTWKITGHSGDYILQKVNHAVFQDPAVIARNIDMIASWISQKHPSYCFVAPLKTKTGDSLLHIPGDGYYRVFPFVNNSVTHETAASPAIAFEAARQFGRFTQILSDLPAHQLGITIPHFHNLSLRYAQFVDSLAKGNQERVQEAQGEIEFLQRHRHFVHIYESIMADEQFRLRVTHHDTKISNVLCDKNDKGICVIDLDTVMPGHFISDVGDMMRTYLSPANEETTDVERIEVRDDYFRAIVDGYLGEMRGELTEGELHHFVYAGHFMTYMQALRFLTDYLHNDRYYGARYEEHNYMRARNQVVLLQRMMEKERKLKEILAAGQDH